MAQRLERHRPVPRESTRYGLEIHGGRRRDGQARDARHRAPGL